MNWARVIWVTALFLLLIVILLMVMDYKINYQYLPNNELYFYECDGNLCVMEVVDENSLMYSKYDCGLEECPFYRKKLDDNYVLLEKDGEVILYQYLDGKVISQDYDEYMVLSSDYFIVKMGEFYGVIDNDNHLVVNVDYEQIGHYVNEYLTGYNTEYVLAKRNGKYGIISYKDGSVLEPFKYVEDDLELLLDILKKEETIVS